jgi:RNA polymerase sigma factor (sigma-70 family)
VHSTNKYTEDALVALLKTKDTAAFNYLYQNYKGALLAVILPFFNNNYVQAEDVLQECFVTIFNKIDQYNATKGRLFTWMHTLARNASINTIRSKEYKTGNKNQLIDNYVTDLENTHNTAFNEEVIGLKKEVYKLKPEFKIIVEMAYYYGYTQDEISKQLNIPLGTVKTRMRNALAALRKNFI